MTDLSSVSGLRGVRELVTTWRADAAKGKAKAAKLKLGAQDVRELTEYDTAMEHCANDLERELAALSLPPSPQAPTDEEPRKYWPMGCGHSSYWRIDELDQCELCELRKAAEEGIDANTLRSSPAGAQGQVQGVQESEDASSHPPSGGQRSYLADPDKDIAAISERIWCMECGKSVSTPVPKDTIVRAWVECPECIEKNAAAKLAAAQLTSLAAPPADVSSQAGQPVTRMEDGGAMGSHYVVPNAGSGQEGLREPTNEHELLVGGIVRAALELAILRGDLRMDNGAAFEEMSESEREDVISDTWNAMNGEGTCDDEPVKELTAIYEALHSAPAGQGCDMCKAPKEIADDGEHVCGLTASQAYSLGWRRGNNAAAAPSAGSGQAGSAPEGTSTPWGKVVKHGHAYWCVPDGDTVAVAVSAELIESTLRRQSLERESK